VIDLMERLRRSIGAKKVEPIRRTSAKSSSHRAGSKSRRTRTHRAA